MSDLMRGALEVRNVGKAFGEGEPVVKDCSFAVAPGGLAAMVGPSGCGKTTLVNLIAGYETVGTGEILLDGKPVRGAGADRLVVFQETALFPWMTVRENVVFGPLARGGASRSAVDARARQLLETVGLSEFADRYPSQLSGGMQRRAELARATINEPTVMVLDEPFRGLDAMTRGLMQEHVLQLFEHEPRTTLFVTSELTEAIFLADQLLVMSGRPARVKRVISIDLPRPRRFGMLTSARFRELFEDALVVLHEERARALA